MSASQGFPFAEDYREQPWWWEAAPPEPPAPVAELPAKVDALVVGAGLTGLNAALTLASAGASTLVLDAHALGNCASTMNAGFVGRVLKHGFGALVRREGLESALRAYAETERAFGHVLHVVEAEGIGCHLRRCGRFIAARTPSQLAQIRAEYALRDEHLGTHFHEVSGERIREELASEAFPAGGIVIPDLASLHPGLYHRGLLAAARRAGALVVGDCAVLALRREPDGHRVITTHGDLLAREVLVATNGQTDARLPWFRRRVIPFNGYMIATEAMPEELLHRLIPEDRTVHDWHDNLVFLRRAPDAPRLLLGWSTGARAPLVEIAKRLRGKLVSLFPELDQTRVARVWTGYCAGTFDLMPHIGRHQGLHYAMGWCFAGVPMGSWLGHVAARRMLGEEFPTAFDDRPLHAPVWYRGNPWFVPWYMRWLDWRDRRAA